MRNILSVAALLISVAATSATMTVQSAVEHAIESSKCLSAATVAVRVMTPDGEVIVDINSDKLLIPASNMKLVTTGVALDRLSGDYRFETSIGCSGRIVDGTLDGDLVIIGGADPTLADPEAGQDGAMALFARWKLILDQAGIKCIRGKVVGDAAFIGGMKEHPDWEWADIGTYYGTGVCGLQFYGNTLNFRVRPGNAVGTPLTISQVYPRTPWMTLSYDCSTGPGGTGDMLYLYTTDLSHTAVLRGTFALGKAEKTVKCSNKYPDLTCAREFSEYLKSNGVPNGGYEASHVECVRVLGRTFSENLDAIVKKTNFNSDNFYAETIFRVLSKEVCGRSDYESAAAAEAQLLESRGITVEDRVAIRDGSGLSARNHLTASFMCDFLAMMMTRPCWPDFRASLPRAGKEGTVAGSLLQLPESVRSGIYMKSGTHTGVRAFSGYYFPEGDVPVIFSVIVNNCPASQTELKSAVDEVLGAIFVR